MLAGPVMLGPQYDHRAVAATAPDKVYMDGWKCRSHERRCHLLWHRAYHYAGQAVKGFLARDTFQREESDESVSASRSATFSREQRSQ